jgi:hypothetical protein
VQFSEEAVGEQGAKEVPSGPALSETTTLSSMLRSPKISRSIFRAASLSASGMAVQGRDDGDEQIDDRVRVRAFPRSYQRLDQFLDPFAPSVAKTRGG